MENNLENASQQNISQDEKDNENEYKLKYQTDSSPTNITTGTTGFAPDSSVEEQDNSAGDSIEIIH